jgi:hypothetical protein
MARRLLAGRQPTQCAHHIKAGNEETFDVAL